MRVMAYLKAKSFSKAARPKRLNLVAPILQLGNLPADDPAVALLRKDLKTDVGIPEELTTKLLSALAGVDYLGSLLKVDAAVEDALKNVELEFERTHGQGNLFGGFPAQQVKFSVGEAKASILDKLEQFLAKHSKSEDLGLRLDGEQLAAGVRFVRMVREGTYDLVIGNPPYQGITKTQSFEYVTKTYPRGKADLCTAFLEHGLELARPGGLSAMVAMRGWMFLGQFADLRRHLLHAYDLRTLGDLDKGAFESMPTSQLISVAMTVFRNSPHSNAPSIALQPTAPGEKFWGPDRTELKRAAVLAQRNRYEFDPRDFQAIEGETVVYWWSKDFLEKYAAAPKLGASSPAKAGAVSGNHSRFLRMRWELGVRASLDLEPDEPLRSTPTGWVRYVKGARGLCWIDPCDEVCNWRASGLEIKTNAEAIYGSYTRQIRNERLYFKPGIAVAGIGSSFSCRRYRWRSVFDNMAASVFPADVEATVCAMNSTSARTMIQSLNTGLHFEIGDVNRLAIFPVASADKIFAALNRAFAEHESYREPSVEFRAPGSSAWEYAQDWAQLAVDRADGAPLPQYAPVLTAPAPIAFVSFAIGVALGRFGANREGVLDEPPPIALPSGILFVAQDGSGGLQHPACTMLHAAWVEHGAVVGTGDNLPTYVRKSFFELHNKLYGKRPIYFPLSSAKKSFVAVVSIHRWADDTLNVLLADHLVPTRRRLEGELGDLRTARASGSNKGNAEKRFTEVQKLLEELNDFISKVTEVAEKGPPPPDDKTEKRHADAKFVMDLDDGVMVNSAAFWPLLEAQWKDPKKWWKELANAQGKKDYDWSHLAARYFPDRVRKKCQEDPSLAVAHKCFWELHPAKAYAWELRLQDEIRPDFTIDEPGSNAVRAKFLKEHASEASEVLAKELKRREKKSAKADDEGDAGPLFDQESDEPEAEAADA